MRSHSAQGVGLGDSGIAFTALGWGTSSAPAATDMGREKSTKKPKMHSIPIKGSVRAGPGCPLPVWKGCSPKVGSTRDGGSTSRRILLAAGTAGRDP